MYSLGIDIGSASSKVVIIDNAQNIIADAVFPGGAGTSGTAKVLDEVFWKSGLGWKDIDRTVATGYGRIGFHQANHQVSEITCHALGVHHLFPSVRTIIDIGGQDVKAISISKEGVISKFVMNDKCAAGTGRFLEVMSRVLETDVSELGVLAGKADTIVDISSTCAEADGCEPGGAAHGLGQRGNHEGGRRARREQLHSLLPGDAGADTLE
jgi:predicted CoA-substrate-specific enzyme activase